jgi:hypothetical protein
MTACLLIPWPAAVSHLLLPSHNGANPNSQVTDTNIANIYIVPIGAARREFSGGWEPPPPTSHGKFFRSLNFFCLLLFFTSVFKQILLADRVQKKLVHNFFTFSVTKLAHLKHRVCSSRPAMCKV